MVAAALIVAAVLALPPAEVIERIAAPEADQGVAVDARSIYAVDNSTIARYDRKTGAKVAVFRGDKALYPHMNSCAVIGRELVCAASNFPATPMMSQVEVFDPATLKHLRTIPLGHQPGSLTWVDRKDGAWWAGFANYDGRGGETGRDHTATKLVKFDTRWKAQATWTFPTAVLDRMKPYSASGGTWGADGRLYVTGHDRPELYVLEAPKGGGVLKLVALAPIPVSGQAIAFDRGAKGVLFGVNRATREVVGFRLAPLEAK
jgi:outer membrane protein assembly factor BamB